MGSKRSRRVARTRRKKGAEEVSPLADPLPKDGGLPAVALRTAVSGPTLRELGEEVNRDLCALHGARRAELGETKSGLFQHYSVLLDRGRLVGKAEVETVSTLIDQSVQAKEYVVLKAGLGEVALLLALTGNNVTACEPHLCVVKRCGPASTIIAK